MLKEKIQDALNLQINKELFSAYLYQSMSADFAAKNFDGAAGWMAKQAGEEVEHAQRIYKHIIERGGKVVLKAIDAPKTSWKSHLDAFEEAYAHEQMVTDSINKIVDLAQAEKDHATASFLQWFVDEQVEEEDQTSAIVEKLKMIKDAPGALFMFDAHLGRRE
ncbi:MAG: ferritin [Candidatus Auribacterota bacterium]|nr:ferritin [Candidatus Auribacterota bacterium]